MTKLLEGSHLSGLTKFCIDVLTLVLSSIKSEHRFVDSGLISHIDILRTKYRKQFYLVEQINILLFCGYEIVKKKKYLSNKCWSDDIVHVVNSIEYTWNKIKKIMAFSSDSLFYPRFYCMVVCKFFIITLVCNNFVFGNIKTLLKN